MSDSLFLDAVRGVKHREDCWQEQGRTEADGTSGYGECNCDRDERIAKGLRAVIENEPDGYWQHDERTDDYPEALAAFTEASR